MNSLLKTSKFVSKSHKNEELCIKNEGFCIENDEFCRSKLWVKFTKLKTALKESRVIGESASDKAEQHVKRTSE